MNFMPADIQFAPTGYLQPVGQLPVLLFLLILPVN
jgi:hypothetical protein